MSPLKQQHLTKLGVRFGQTTIELHGLAGESVGAFETGRPQVVTIARLKVRGCVCPCEDCGSRIVRIDRQRLFKKAPRFVDGGDRTFGEPLPVCARSLEVIVSRRRGFQQGALHVRHVLVT